VNSLRGMSSEEAADWLMDRYPVDSNDYGWAFVIAPHLSWKRADQLRLADYYFSKLPFASGRPFEAFASFMSVSRLVDVLRRHLSADKRAIDLTGYYSVPVLKRNAKSPKDHQAVQSFAAELKARLKALER
jgi:hypothetical protein